MCMCWFCFLQVACFFLSGHCVRCLWISWPSSTTACSSGASSTKFGRYLIASILHVFWYCLTCGILHDFLFCMTLDFANFAKESHPKEPAVVVRPSSAASEDSWPFVLNRSPKWLCLKKIRSWYFFAFLSKEPSAAQLMDVPWFRMFCMFRWNVLHVLFGIFLNIYITEEKRQLVKKLLELEQQAKQVSWLHWTFWIHKCFFHFKKLW